MNSHKRDDRSYFQREISAAVIDKDCSESRTECSAGNAYRKFLYRGRSMHPLLKDGDLLYLRPCAEGSIKPGDVIVFDALEAGSMIAHRVTAIDAGRIRTKGDNNFLEDFRILGPSAIRGKVHYARRGRKVFPIRGGCFGRLTARFLNTRKSFMRAAVWLLRPIYRSRVLSGLLSPLVPQMIRPKVVCFTRPDGNQLHLLMGKRVIGLLPAGEVQWTIEPPFRLFVDESSLPHK